MEQDGWIDNRRAQMLQKRNTSKKLTAEAVADIRKLYGEGATQGALSRYYGVSIGQIGRIVRGESWQEGAGSRMPTQAEMDATLQRMLHLQRQVNEAPELFRQETKDRRAPPPSPLDGGDAPSESQGEGLDAVQAKAAALGVDIDKLLRKTP